MLLERGKITTAWTAAAQRAGETSQCKKTLVFHTKLKEVEPPSKEQRSWEGKQQAQSPDDVVA